MRESRILGKKLDVLVTNGDEYGLKRQDLRMPTTKIQ
jgi:hypothetical protein